MMENTNDKTAHDLEEDRIDNALANFLAEHTRLNQDGIDTHAMRMALSLNYAALRPVSDADIEDWRAEGYVTDLPELPDPYFVGEDRSRDGWRKEQVLSFAQVHGDARAEEARREAAGEIEALHRRIAAETLRADQGWQRYDSANRDRNALRDENVTLGQRTAGGDAVKVPDTWYSEPCGPQVDDLSYGKGYRCGFNDCREKVLELNAAQPVAEAAAQADGYCDACERHVTGPCNSVDCATPDAAPTAQPMPPDDEPVKAGDVLQDGAVVIAATPPVDWLGANMAGSGGGKSPHTGEIRTSFGTARPWPGEPWDNTTAPVDDGGGAEDAERWKFFCDNAQSSINGQTFAEWIAFDGVMQHGSRNAAIDHVRAAIAAKQAGKENGS